uniref:Ovule protein n=2 Tax=Heterorhabditis bacteriophora TaxID=37862 RepID=A0A1I7X3S2_HETBA
MAPMCLKAPEAVQHMNAGRSRSVQNYPTILPKGRWGESNEAKPRLFRALRQSPGSKKDLKNIKKNSPVNIYSSESFNLTVQMRRNLPLLGRQRFISRIAETPT